MGMGDTEKGLNSLLADVGTAWRRWAAASVAAGPLAKAHIECGSPTSSRSAAPKASTVVLNLDGTGDNISNDLE